MARTEPEMTDDGRYIIVNGRHWRATDPSIRADLKDELVHELMSARRAIKNGDLSGRARVNAAKTALGERGEPWWEPTDDGRRSRAMAVINALLRGRRGASVLLGEVAQVVGGDQWQDSVELVEHVVRDQKHDQKWVLHHDGDEPGVTPGPGFEFSISAG